MPSISEDEDPDKARNSIPMPSGAAVFVADAVGGTAQVGAASVEKKEKWEGGINNLHPLLQPLEDTDIFGNPIGGVVTGGVSVGGGVSLSLGDGSTEISSGAANMQVQRPLASQRPSRRSTNFSSSVSVEKMITKIPMETEAVNPSSNRDSAPSFSFSAMDRMMSQIEENNPESNTEANAEAVNPSPNRDSVITTPMSNLPLPPSFSFSTMDRMMSQIEENIS